MNLDVFIPYYPDVPTTEDITKRLEFNSLWSDVDRDKLLLKKTRKDYFDYQKINIAYILLYDRLFLYNKAGTGKTRTYLGACEQLRKMHLQNKTNIKRAVILTPKATASDVQNQFFESTQLDKMPDFYQILGYEKFIRSLDPKKYHIYDDTIFIIDEAHKLKSQKEKRIDLNGETSVEIIENSEAEDEYSKLYDLFETAKRIKIVVASATPVYDQPEDIVPIMNFLLPANKRLLDSDLKNYESFKYKVGNIVSFVNELKLGTNIVYVKQGKSKINPNLFEIPLSDLQIKQLKECNSCIGIKNYPKIIALEFSGRTNGKLTLENLEKISPKGHFVVKQTMRPETGCCYAFHPYYISGILDVLAQAFIDNGFEKYEGGLLKTKKPRFILFTGDANNFQRDMFIKEFNSAKNIDGEYIKIIITSKVAGVGINLYNVLTVFNLSSSWNYSTAYQGIYRAIRADSHSKLMERGEVNINVYMMCSTSPTFKTLDYTMYEFSENKDKEIKRIERYLKKLAFDCNLNYNRNVIKGKDGSRECDFEECEYKCDYVPTENYDTYDFIYTDTARKLKTAGLIKSEYNLLFADDLIEYIIDDIFEILKRKGVITIDQLIRKYVERGVDEFVVLRALDYLMSIKYRYVINDFGFRRMPVISGNEIVLSEIEFNYELQEERYNGTWFSNNLIAYKTNITAQTKDPVKQEFENMINGEIFDESVYKENKAYFFSVGEDEYKSVLDQLKIPKQGKKSAGGNYTDSRISSLDLPYASKELGPNRIYINTLFLKKLQTRGGVKTGYVSDIRSAKDGETEKVEYYENEWKTDKIKSAILRNIVKKTYERSLDTFFENKNILGAIFTLFPDGMIRLHTKIDGKVSPGINIATSKNVVTVLAKMGMSKSDAEYLKKNTDLLIKKLKETGDLYIFENEN